MRKVPEAGQRMLVTGGAGFIGSHLVGFLLSRGNAVTVVDDLSTGREANLSGFHGAGLECIRARAGEAVPALDPARFRFLYHLAATVGVRRVLERTAESIENNVVESAAVLRWAAQGGVPTFLASSSEVYGRGTKERFAEDDDVVYGPTTALRWSYACAKALDEHLALALHAHEGLPCVIARYFNTVGPRQRGRYGMVLPRFVDAALEGRPLQVHGDGRQTRCFCDVRDIVPATVALLERHAASGRVYNLGAETPISIGALAELVIRTLGSSSTIEFVPYEQAFGPGFDDLRDRRPDTARAREAIGFSPTIPLEQTIRDLAAERSSRREGAHR